MHAIQNITQLLGQTQWYHLRKNTLAAMMGRALGQSWCAVWSVTCWGGACQEPDGSHPQAAADSVIAARLLI